MMTISKKNIKRNGSIIILLTLLLSLLFNLLFTVDINAAYISNNLKNRFVYDLENSDSYRVLTLLDTTFEQKFSNSILYINPHFSYNYHEQEADSKLNEIYLNLYYNNFDLRIGKQKVSWGKADGLVVTNLVNPRDYTNYPVFAYEDQFQAINAVKANYYLGSDTLELIWRPEFKPAIYDKNMLAANLNGFNIDNSQKGIETELENSELLLRYSSLGYEYDYELMLAYIWDEQPTLHKNLVKKIVSPVHHRLAVVGGSFSTMRDAFVLRGEATYTDGKYYNTNDFNRYQAGVVERDQVKLLAGIDYSYQDYQLSYQVLQETILKHEDSIEQEQFTYQMTFLLKRMFLRDRLATELSLYYDASQEQLMAKPKIAYDYSDKINFTIGANYLLKGEQRDDVIYFETEYLF